jgi:hypothetical protein
MAKPMYVGYAEFSHPSWLPSACRHATTGRHIAASPYPGGYHWRPRSNPTEGMVSRRQVAYPFFRVVQIRTALVMTPLSIWAQQGFLDASALILLRYV